ncbi:Fe(2+) transporter permease subunit FeoB [Venatoribacter cucullus]|uniref:Fe(2+) transporter permease subunit FeoB n=1 Tax=Venatoribacter cucullus TaxID=2661630 RepID=UPI00223EF10D|nr:Fe(2+) transporter permease subunit FeoB [Venatoribacter cucullus]UZK03115.1 Fe(2+) transporter permease subunit FeoB [Venatoribacter cucullus]
MKPAVIGVIGNPNCGKTTLFNALTGSRQKVGNWPGVTVDRKEGVLNLRDVAHTLVDLPGTYALDSHDDELSTDEKIAREFALSGEAQLIINILDASNLERNLFLTSQLLDMGIPLVCAVNMLDVAEREGIHVDTVLLSQQLGVPVVPIVAASGQGIEELCRVLAHNLEHPTVATPLLRPDAGLQQAIDDLKTQLHGLVPNPFWSATRILENDRYAGDVLPEARRNDILTSARQHREQLEQEVQQPLDVLLANGRYQAIRSILTSVLTIGRRGRSLTERIDDWVLNRWLGIPFFFGVMYLMFLFAINVSGAFIDFFDIAFATVFVEGPRELLNAVGSPGWLTTLLADGLGGGIQLVATFIPVIGGLYLFLSVIEDSGYMARAAFVMDRLMRAVGLPGKAFVPLIVGFGCNVPAVMAARTMDTEKDRLLTIAMAPFMSCGARLSVYALFAAAFFTSNGALIVFSLYVLGIVMAMLTGMALKNTLFKPELTPFVMELPAYHIPTVKGVLLKTWERLKSFCLRAGKTIVTVVVVLSFLNSFGTDGSFGNEDTDKSVLAKMAAVVTPALSPLGVQDDNWPATVGVITGIFAKEAVVGTLDALYSPDAEASDEGYSLLGGLTEALQTIPDNLAGLADALLDPLGLSLIGADQTEEQDVKSSTFTRMGELFGSQLAAFSYLVFVLLYTPCVATLGAMVREAGLRWMLFVAGWSTGLAYTTAVVVYQVGSFGQHPLSSSLWIAGSITFIGGCLLTMRRYGQQQDAKRIPLVQL